MKRLLKSTAIVAILFASVATAEISAQNVSDLIINEVMVDNENSIVDEYGNRSGWIEIYNTSYATVDFSGCYLSDDAQNLKKYYIPKGDSRTKVKPQQIKLFFACSEAEKGTFHTNFNLKAGSTVYLVSNDGKTIIDSIEIPSDLPADKSVAKICTDNKGLVFKTIVCDPSPMSKNQNLNSATKSQIMAERDPHGFIMAITAICVVFIALIILYLFYKYIGKAYTGKIRLKKTSGKKGGKTDEETALAIALALEQECGGEIEAAIAAALHMYMNDTVHDEESFVLTISHKPSAWATKQFMLRQLPTRK